MGTYLILYFVSLALALSFYFLSKRMKKEKLDSIALFFMVLMIFFLVFALYTDDPIEELLTTIPAFWQFAFTSLGGAFTIWKLYLNPLKEKVYGMDKELGMVKTTLNRFEKESKDSFERLEKNFEKVKDK